MFRAEANLITVKSVPAGQSWLSSTINISMHSKLKGELRADFNYDNSLRNKVGLKTKKDSSIVFAYTRVSTGFSFVNT